MFWRAALTTTEVDRRRQQLRRSSRRWAWHANIVEKAEFPVGGRRNCGKQMKQARSKALEVVISCAAGQIRGVVSLTRHHA
ncbi:hypothetical protein Aduo_015104 [Ancylostoma duodenale]